MDNLFIKNLKFELLFKENKNKNSYSILLLNLNDYSHCIE